MLALFAILLIVMSLVQWSILLIKYRREPTLERALLWEGSTIQLVIVVAIVFMVWDRIA